MFTSGDSGPRERRTAPRSRSLGGMIDYIGAIRSESARFHDLISRTATDAPVPSCPGWTVADLAWHLSEVQHFWGSIVDGLLRDPESVQPINRPTDGELAGLFQRLSADLVEAVERRHPDDGCWSWRDSGRSVGWVLRRQAHEALIHRIDAELAGGGTFDVDPELAADGVDEMMSVFVDAGKCPRWATYEPDGSTAIIEIDGGSASWMIDLGRIMGTSPNTGRAVDDQALRLIVEVDDPNAVLRGSGTDTDLWLWGRGPLDRLTVEGDPGVTGKIRAAAVAATQ